MDPRVELFREDGFNINQRRMRLAARGVAGANGHSTLAWPQVYSQTQADRQC